MVPWKWQYIGAFEAALVLLVILGEWQLGDYTPWKMNGWAGSPKSHKQLKKQQHHLKKLNLQPSVGFSTRRWFSSFRITYGRIPCPLKIASTLGGGGKLPWINPQLRSWRDFETPMETYHFPWRRVRTECSKPIVVWGEGLKVEGGVELGAM